jgi:hypothetical protein
MNKYFMAKPIMKKLIMVKKKMVYVQINYG